MEHFSITNSEAALATVNQSSAAATLDMLRELGSISSATQDAYQSMLDGLRTRTTNQKPGPTQVFSLEPGADLAAMNLVIGVGLGLSYDSRDFTQEPGEICLHMYTSEPMSKESAVGYACAAFKAEALASGEAAVRVIHTGQIDLLAHRFRLRPAPGGISIGHVDVTAGTLGCLARGVNPPRTERTLVLSNNHVLANVNAGSLGDEILQPGKYDGGQQPQDVIGILERFVTIDFNGPNYVDCATAWVDPEMVRPELVFLKGGSQPSYFRASGNIVAARNGMMVGKSGRTTQLTAGQVTAVGVAVQVNMGGGRVAQFEDQISIRGVNGGFSQGGDSGSLVWTWEERDPLGLLFAGGGDITFANPLHRVLNALEIELLV
ncbi:MAG: hypothetical protein WBO24_12190 [Nitrospirales bacterium]